MNFFITSMCFHPRKAGAGSIVNDMKSQSAVGRTLTLVVHRQYIQDYQVFFCLMQFGLVSIQLPHNNLVVSTYVTTAHLWSTVSDKFSGAERSETVVGIRCASPNCLYMTFICDLRLNRHSLCFPAFI